MKFQKLDVLSWTPCWSPGNLTAMTRAACHFYTLFLRGVMLISEYYFCLCLFLLRESSVRKMILLHAWPIVTTFTHLTHDLTNFLSVIIWSRYRPISCSHRRSCIVSQSSRCCDHLSAFSTFMLLTPLPTHPPPSLCRFISFIIPSISPPVSGLHVGGGGGLRCPGPTPLCLKIPNPHQHLLQ